ncbi:MAG: effector-associated domain EAD1-containing protein [Dolichospermum sp.]
MKLLPNDRKKLLTIILESYPDIAEIEILIRLELGENLDDIVGGSNNKQKIFKLIEWAETRGTLIDLLNAISKDRPDNVELQETIKNLLEKSSQNSKINPDEDDQKKNKLALVIKNCCVGLVIIVTGFMGYRFFQPELNCNNKQLQEQDNSIKIIIADFEGNPDPNLKTYLFEKLKTKIPPNRTVTICQVNQKAKDSFAANNLRNKLFPKNPNSVLVIWGTMSEPDFLGGIKFMNDKSDDITFDVPLHKKDKLMFKDSLLKTLNIQINYTIALIFFRQNKTWESQTLLENTLGSILNCQINNEKVVINFVEESRKLNSPQIAKSYDLLGDVYQENKNFDSATKYYQCSHSLEKDTNKQNTLLLKQAENYDRNNNIKKALLMYERVIDKGSDQLKTRALVSRATIFANRGECPKAEEELHRVIEGNLHRPNGLEIRSNIRFFSCSNRLGAIKDLSEFCILSNPTDCQKSIDLIIQLITTEYDQQEYQKIVSELEEIKQAHPEWQKIIDKLLNKR